MKIASAVKELLRVREASAHCDIPCGIYDPILAKIAAQTVLKMVMRIDALDGDDVAAQNSLSRYITVKEEHAALCKSELNILANDYFKENHIPGVSRPAHEGVERDRTRLRQQAGRQPRIRSAARGRGGRDREYLLGHQGRRVQRPRRRGPARNVETGLEPTSETSA